VCVKAKYLHLTYNRILLYKVYKEIKKYYLATEYINPYPANVENMVSS